MADTAERDTLASRTARFDSSSPSLVLREMLVEGPPPSLASARVSGAMRVRAAFPFCELDRFATKLILPVLFEFVLELPEVAGAAAAVVAVAASFLGGVVSLESDCEWPRVRISCVLVPELLAPADARRGELPLSVTSAASC